MSKHGKLAAGAGVVAAALAVAGCGSSHVAAKSGASAYIGSSAISRAASVSGAAQGEKVAYTFTEQLPSIGKLSMTGTGSFNRSPAEGAMSLDLTVPNASSLGSEASAILSNLKLNLVFDNKVIFLQVPSSLSSMASSFTGGKPWVSVDLAKLAATGKIPGLSNLLSGPSTSSASPATAFQRLQQASSTGVTKVGSATVNGVSTTEYSGTLNLSKLATTSATTAAQRAQIKKALARSAKQMGTTTIPYDVYIDGSNLIRRLSINFSPTVHGTTVPITAQLDFLSYGKQPAPSVPAASSVFSLNGLLSSLGSAGGTFGASING